MREASTQEKTTSTSSFRLLISGYRNFFSELGDLFLAECRLFATCLVQLFCLAVFAAIVSASAWVVICAMIYIGLLKTGITGTGALTVLLMLHIGLLVTIAWAIHHTVTGLEFQHLRGQLAGDRRPPQGDTAT